MAGPSWLVDSKRIATKIKSASGTCDHGRVKWKSNPTRTCPNCNCTIDNSDVTQEWPGLPRGVKFDPSDEEIILHLLAKVGVGNAKPHPFIDEFIPTVNEDDGICYTHPQNLPGVKQDGSVSHFFYRAIKAYNSGTRKRRKIKGDDDLGDVRWHKTGKTKPVILDGVQKGCKKIMVLYMSKVKGGKSEKTNWVMHQYHLGEKEDEDDREYVISKISYQTQAKQSDKIEQDLALDLIEGMHGKVDPDTPEPTRTERRHSDLYPGKTAFISVEPSVQHLETGYVEGTGCVEDTVQPERENLDDQDHQIDGDGNHMMDNHDNHNGEDPKWWEGESQFLLDSQQLVEGLSLCDEFLQSQNSTGDGDGDGEERKPKVSLAEYARIGAEALKKDLEECQNLGFSDPANIELDTPPDFRLSQLEFGSQDSFAWGGSKLGD